MDDYGDFASFGLDPAADSDAIYSGDTYGSTAAGVPVPIRSIPILPGDLADAQVMERWNMAPKNSDGDKPPWWGSAMVYGLTRVIDNVFPYSPTGTMGNTYPGSGAGASGRTYTQRPTGAGGGVVRATVRTPIGSASGNSSTWLLLAIAAAFLLFKR